MMHLCVFVKIYKRLMYTLSKAPNRIQMHVDTMNCMQFLQNAINKTNYGLVVENMQTCDRFEEFCETTQI